VKITDAENLVRDRLGPDYSVVNLSGWWLVYPTGRMDQQTRSKSLDKAIRDQQGAAR
jgi:hypothetical protein